MQALQASLDETFDEEGDSEFFVWEQAVGADSKKWVYRLGKHNVGINIWVVSLIA